MHNGEHGHSAGEYALEGLATHADVAKDVLSRYQEVTPRYRAWLMALGVLFILGIVGFILRLMDGFEDGSNWGYFVATLSFILSTFMAMPIISAGLRLTKANWRRPFTRVVENMAITGVLMTLMVPVALAALPPLEGRLNIWFDFPLGAPGVWDFIAYGTLALTGLALLWTLALPDLAAARDHLPASSARLGIVRWLAAGWEGSLRQWRVQRQAALVLGAVYLLTYPLVQTLMVADFHLGLLPGSKDAIFPATQVVYALQSGIGLTMMTMFAMRRMGGYTQYFTVEQFWALAKPMLALAMLWFYFWWASFISFWYGREPRDVATLQYLFLGPWMIPFFTSFILNFLGPLIALIWNPVRRSIWGPTIVGTSIVLGALINQTRLMVSAFAVPDHSQHVLNPIPPAQWPGVPDLLIVVGGISGCVLLFMLVSKIIPPVSIFEVAEGLRLVKVRRFLGRTVRVIAKSH